MNLAYSTNAYMKYSISEAIERVAEIGYEGIETVLLNTQWELFRPLQSSSERIQALERWVELGGKLVVFCGAEAEELLAVDGPLAKLVPGKFVEMLPLRQWQPLETYSGAAKPKTQQHRLDLRVPRLTDVRGQILAHAGRRPTQSGHQAQPHLVR